METSLGGADESFPETALSTLLSGPAPRHAEALNRLFARYWRPVYRVIRTSGGKSIEDAKDLTQGFFDYILEEDLIAKFRRDRGRFRSFLKGVLRNYLSESRRRDASLKRGGCNVVLSLDTDAIERDTLALPSSATPDEIFDRQWAADVLRESLEALRSELREGPAWKAFEAYELSSGQPTYADVGRATGLSESQVKDALTLCRDRLRDCIARRISDVVASQEEFIQEMRELLSR